MDLRQNWITVLSFLISMKNLRQHALALLNLQSGKMTKDLGTLMIWIVLQTLGLRTSLYFKTMVLIENVMNGSYIKQGEKWRDPNEIFIIIIML